MKKLILICLLVSSQVQASQYIFKPKWKQIDTNKIIQDIVDGNYSDRGEASLFMRPKKNKWRDLVWRVTHIDDLIFGATVGIGSWILGIHKKGYKEMRKAADGTKQKRITVARRDIKEKFVVFSDHHLLGHTKKHDYFKSWRQDGVRDGRTESLDIYMQALKQYHQEGYTLVEAGDVEDLVTIEPTYKVALLDQLFDLFALPFSELADEKFENKQKQIQLLDIFYNYQEMYKQIRETFVKDDKFVKLIGNHDVKLKREPFLGMVRKIYQKEDFEVNDYLVIAPKDGYAKYIVAHGHQIDPWCNEKIAKSVSENFTQSEAWFGNGADRIWPKYEGGDGGWLKKMRSGQGFHNGLAIAPSFKRERGMATKFRHMGERKVEKLMSKAFKGAPNVPTLVLGHTHEPKIGAIDKKGKQFYGYVNTGATGHYEQLLWCVEIVDGKPNVFAWFVDENNKILKKRMVPTKSGRLIPEA